MANYRLIVTPKHCFNSSLYERRRSGSVSKELHDYIEFNTNQRELIIDIIESECVKSPIIEHCWTTDENRFFSISDLHVYYDESSGMSKTDILNSLRYIGEELLPWVDSVTLTRVETPKK